MTNLNKMNHLIDQTEELINTLSQLNNEIESYQLAKDNLVEVKEKLNQFVDGAFEANSAISVYIKELHQLVNSDVVSKIDSINDSLQKVGAALDIQLQFLMKHEKDILLNQKNTKLLLILGGLNLVGVITLIIFRFV
jgi:hypothetical protein